MLATSLSKQGYNPHSMTRMVNTADISLKMEKHRMLIQSSGTINESLSIGFNSQTENYASIA